MKYVIASKLKALSPSLYKVAFSLYFWLSGVLDRPRYFYCRIAGKPYFGPVMLGAQTWPTRDPHMRNAIRQLLAQEGRKEEFRVLEIGSWAGQSAILWATELVRSGRPGKVFCVDPWMPFVSEGNVGVNTAVSIMNRAAQRDKIFPLFWHNVKSSGLAGTIIPLRGKSTDILPCLQPGFFDLAFVDGSHAYSDFLNDLNLAGPLVKEHGFICGDDLEMQSDEVDPSFAEESREKDYVTDPKTRRDYHPGVCLGVAHFFKRRVCCYDGFWVARKNAQRWDDAQIG